MPSVRLPHSTHRLAFAAVLSLAATAARGQGSEIGAAVPAARIPTGWEVAGLPALNYDADEGFGYGAIVELYDYGRGVRPYRLTIQPTLFLTTEGRRDVTLFVDAPELLPGGWRLSAFVGRERQLAQPYYGVGNATPYDKKLEAAPNPYFYRFGRTRDRVTADLQHRISALPARLLLGAGAANVAVDATPFDSGTTLLATELAGAAPPRDRERWIRAGLVWDSRDREIGPGRGTWAEGLVQRVDRRLGSDENFTRVTVTARHYVPITARLTFAQRVTVQNVAGDVPFHELATIQSSFKQFDGLGGSSSLRGVPKNRFVGRGILLENSELRWRARELSILGKPSSLVLSAFADAGRVWTDHVDVASALKDLHAGYGGGVRVAYGPSFVVAVDVGHSSQAAAPIYIGLGFLF